MKKLSSLIAIAIIVAFQTANAAQPTSPLVITPTTTAPTIDGDAKDATWTGITAQPINVIYTGEAAGFDADGSGDLDATFKVTYDASKMYFLFTVNDDIITQDPAAHWLGDKVEIYFGLPGYLASDNAHSANTRQFDFTASFDPNVLHGQLSYTGSADPATDGVESAYTETATGYIIEVSLDRTIALANVPDMATIGFDICIADNDVVGGAGVRFRKSWFNDGAINELWNTMVGAGQLTLNGKTALKSVSVNLPYSLSNSTLSFNTVTNATINLFDIAGAQISASTNTNKLNVSNLKSGVYFAVVTGLAGEIIGKVRFVK